LQDTGWSAHYPTGNGLFAFQTMEEALAGISAVNADYAKQCGACARGRGRNVRRRKVLGAMLEQVA
jgi:hypothetical protein